MTKLERAAYDLYMAGRWMLPTDVVPLKRQIQMWENLRDALNLEPGYSTEAGVLDHAKSETSEAPGS